MGRIVTLAVLAALLYLGYTRGIPWIEARWESLEARGAAARGTGGDDEALLCLRLAERANGTFSSIMGRFARPPVDRGEWSTALVTVSAEVGSAESACACSAPGCEPAAEAMAELRQLSLAMDRAVRGDPGGMENPARRQARIEEELAEARRLVAGSSP